MEPMDTTESNSESTLHNAPVQEDLSAKLDTLINLQQKTLLHARIRSGLIGAGVLLLLIVSIVLFVKLHQVSTLIADVSTVVRTIREKTEALKTEDLSDTLTALKNAANNLSGFNMDDFNEGVRLFGDAVEQFKDLDITNLNGLVESLKTVSERLERATSVFGSLFGGR